MNKRNLLLLSTLLNLFFVFFFVVKIRQPTLKVISQGDENTVSQKDSNISPEVFGEKNEKANVKVARVIDGDTIALDTGEVVRYIGIDAPETSRGQDCFANESTNKNKELVLDKAVSLEKDISEEDKYGRLLRYVYVDPPSPAASEGQRIFVNEYLVRQGYATVATYPPDVKHAELFKEAEREARHNNHGLWKECESSRLDSSESKVF